MFIYIYTRHSPLRSSTLHAQVTNTKMNTQNVEQQHNAYVTTSNPLWSREKSSGKTFQHALSCSRQPSLCTQTRCFPGIIIRPRCLCCTSIPLVSPSSPLSTDFAPLAPFWLHYLYLSETAWHYLRHQPGWSWPTGPYTGKCGQQVVEPH